MFSSEYSYFTRKHLCNKSYEQRELLVSATPVEMGPPIGPGQRSGERAVSSTVPVHPGGRALS